MLKRKRTFQERELVFQKEFHSFLEKYPILVTEKENQKEDLCLNDEIQKNNEKETDSSTKEVDLSKEEKTILYLLLVLKDNVDMNLYSNILKCIESL